MTSNTLLLDTFNITRARQGSYGFFFPLLDLATSFLFPSFFFATSNTPSKFFVSPKTFTPSSSNQPWRIQQAQLCPSSASLPSLPRHLAGIVSGPVSPLPGSWLPGREMRRGLPAERYVFVFVLFPFNQSRNFPLLCGTFSKCSTVSG